jgi:hypothetical protein
VARRRRRLRQQQHVQQQQQQPPPEGRRAGRGSPASGWPRLRWRCPCTREQAAAVSPGGAAGAQPMLLAPLHTRSAAGLRAAVHSAASQRRLTAPPHSTALPRPQTDAAAASPQPHRPSTRPPALCTRPRAAPAPEAAVRAVLVQEVLHDAARDDVADVVGAAAHVLGEGDACGGGVWGVGWRRVGELWVVLVGVLVLVGGQWAVGGGCGHGWLVVVVVLEGPALARRAQLHVLAVEQLRRRWGPHGALAPAPRRLTGSERAAAFALGAGLQPGQACGRRCQGQGQPARQQPPPAHARTQPHRARRPARRPRLPATPATRQPPPSTSAPAPQRRGPPATLPSSMSAKAGPPLLPGLMAASIWMPSSLVAAA